MVGGGEGDLCVIGPQPSGRLRKRVISERVTVWGWEVAKSGGKGILCVGRWPIVGGSGSYKGVSLYAILIAVNFSGKVQQENIIRVLVNDDRDSERERKEIYESIL